jgi:hypothetical protein
MQRSSIIFYRIDKSPVLIDESDSFSRQCWLRDGITTSRIEGTEQGALNQTSGLNMFVVHFQSIPFPGPIIHSIRREKACPSPWGFVFTSGIHNP